MLVCQHTLQHNYPSSAAPLRHVVVDLKTASICSLCTTWPQDLPSRRLGSRHPLPVNSRRSCWSRTHTNLRSYSQRVATVVVAKHLHHGLRNVDENLSLDEALQQTYVDSFHQPHRYTFTGIPNESSQVIWDMFGLGERNISSSRQERDDSISVARCQSAWLCLPTMLCCRCEKLPRSCVEQLKLTKDQSALCMVAWKRTNHHGSVTNPTGLLCV